MASVRAALAKPTALAMATVTAKKETVVSLKPTVPMAAKFANLEKRIATVNKTPTVAAP